MKVIMNGKEKSQKIDYKIENFPVNKTIHLRGKKHCEYLNTDNWLWKEEENYRKTNKRSPMSFEDILGRRVLAGI